MAACALLSLSVSGCREPTSVSAFDLRLDRTSGWSSDELHVVSQRFATDTQLLDIRIDDSVATPRRINDSTLAIHFPILSGDHSLVVRAPGLNFSTVIHTYGFGGVRAGPAITGYALDYPAAGAGAFLANGESRLLLINAASGSTSAFPDSVHTPWCMRGPGPGFPPNRVLLRHGADWWSCSRTEVWDLTLTPSLVESRGDTTSRLAAQLGTGGWLIGSHHRICTYGVGNPGFCQGLEEVNAVRISPRGDYALPLVHYTVNLGVPIYDGASGLPRYYVPGLYSSGGASFTPTGDTLLLVGDDSARSFNLHHLLALDAATGRELRRTSVPLAGLLYDLVITGSWVVVAMSPMATDPSVPTLLVFDRATLSHVATLAVPATTPCHYILCGELRFVSSGRDGLVYVVETSGSDWFTPYNGTSQVFTFTLAP